MTGFNWPAVRDLFKMETHTHHGGAIQAVCLRIGVDTFGERCLRAPWAPRMAAGGPLVEFFSTQLTPGLVGGAAASLIIPEGKVLCISSISAQGCPAQVRPLHCRQLERSGPAGLAQLLAMHATCRRVLIYADERQVQAVQAPAWLLAQQALPLAGGTVPHLLLTLLRPAPLPFGSIPLGKLLQQPALPLLQPVPSSSLCCLSGPSDHSLPLLSAMPHHPAAANPPPLLSAPPLTPLSQSMQRFPLWTDAVLSLVVSCGNRPPTQLWRSDWVRHKYDSVRMYWVPHFGGACYAANVLLS